MSSSVGAQQRALARRHLYAEELRLFVEERGDAHALTPEQTGQRLTTLSAGLGAVALQALSETLHPPRSTHTQ